jgi:hypothetical protein
MKAIRLTLLIGILGLAGCKHWDQFQLDERNRAAITPKKTPIPTNLPAPKLPASFVNRGGWTNLFNGKDLTGWKETDYAGRGKVVVKNGELHIENGLVITGVTFTNKTILPKTNYEIIYQAKKVNGADFFALLTFPVGEKHASLVTGGWGGAVTGISSINSMDASENDTTLYLKYNQDQWYTFRVRVTLENLSVWMTPKEHLIKLNATVASIVKAYQEDAAKAGQDLNATQAEAALRALNPDLDKNIPARDTIYFPGEAQIIDESIKDKVVEMRPGEIELSAPLGFATFQSYGVIRDVRLRKLPKPTAAKPYGKTEPPAKPAPKPKPKPPPLPK